jgi:hypothetical protein
MNIKIGDIVEWGTGQSRLIGFVIDINKEKYTTTICWFDYPDYPEQYTMKALKSFKKVE